MNYIPPGSSVHGFSRQEWWSGLPFPPPGDLSNLGIQPRSPSLQADSLPKQTFNLSVQLSSVAQSCPTLFEPMNHTMPDLPIHHQLPELTQTHVHRVLSSVDPFSSCPQSLPASGSSRMSQLFAWGGQSIGVSALASVLPKNTQDWSPLGRTGWTSLQSKGISRVFSNTTVQKHQFFSSTQLSSQSNSYIHTWPL